MATPRLSRISIRWVLPLAMMLPVLVVAIVLIVLGYRTAERTSDDLAGQTMRHVHRRIEAHLNHLLDLPPTINRLSRMHLEDGSLSLDDPARSRAFMCQSLKTFPEVSSIGLAGAGGEMTWVIRYPGDISYEYGLKARPDGKLAEYLMDAEDNLPAKPSREFDYDPRSRPWYKAAMEAQGPTWSDVYVWVRGGLDETLGVTYAEPFVDAAGVTRGVINAEITLADISAFLHKLDVSRFGVAFVIERNGYLVADSVNSPGTRDGTGRLPAVDSDNAIIADVAKLLPEHFGPLDQIQGVQQRHPEMYGAGMQVVVSSFKNRRNLDWLIVTAAPDIDFLAAAYQARERSMYIGVGAVLAAMALGVAISTWLLRPILAVVRHARQVGNGDLDARLERHDNREISLLCHALNDMAAGLQDRVRMRHALKLAMEVQQHLLPATGPQVEGVDIAGRSQYCDETGGDYYDFLNVEQMSPNSVLVALGDVMGHGVAAAMLMATARGILRSHVRTAGSLGDLLTHVNDLLVHDTKGTRFMTMFLGVIDAGSRTLRWASAGHDEPLLYDPATKQAIPINADGSGLPLGVMEGQVYQELTHVGLREGQVMLIGTDGLWESRNEAGEEFGKARVLAALAELADQPAAEIERGLYDRLKAFCGAQPIHDDITYVVVKFVASC